MTSDERLAQGARIIEAASYWADKHSEAFYRKNRKDMTVSGLAHDMCVAAHQNLRLAKANKR